MDLTVVIQQVRQQCTSFALRVAGAAEYESARKATALAVPCAFIVPLDDQPEPNGSANSLRQLLTEGVAVVVAVDNQVDERGQAAAAHVDAIRSELWRALLNWPPAARYQGFAYQGGQLLAIDRGRLWWQFEFGAETEIDDSDGWRPDLPHFDGATVRVDQIDPAADRNLQYPGPDGRIETEVRISGLPE